MRCAWCPAGATAIYRAGAACWAHVDLLHEMDDALRGLLRAGVDPHQRAEDAVADRDARELRGEAIDWTRPVEGWLLF